MADHSLNPSGTDTSAIFLNVPFWEHSGSVSSDEIIAALRDRGESVMIDRMNWADQYPEKQEAEARLLHDGNCLYILFLCNENGMRAVVDKDLGPVAQDSCVEFFVCPDFASPRYWNFEFNAIGRKNVSTRIVRPEPQRLTPDELDRIEVCPSVGKEPFEERKGYQMWSLLVAIPLNLIGLEFSGEPIRMKGNLYKCASASCHPHYQSWAPITTQKPDFHRVEYFAPITLLGN